MRPFEAILRQPKAQNHHFSIKSTIKKPTIITNDQNKKIQDNCEHFRTYLLMMVGFSIDLFTEKIVIFCLLLPQNGLKWPHISILAFFPTSAINYLSNDL